MIQLGETIENGTVRIHHYSHQLQITDITNAGKRGKTVKRISADGYCNREAVIALASIIDKCKTFEEAETLVRATDLDIYESEYKGVRIKPAGFETIKTQNEFVSILAEYDSFTICDLKDTYNEERVIPYHNSKKSTIKKFYTWASKKTLQESENFNDVVREISNADISYHRYCAMD